MVGAIADWFAVTGLFKHPPGLPIAHTTIIPTRQNGIAKQFGQFFHENFLSETLIIEKFEPPHSHPSSQNCCLLFLLVGASRISLMAP